MDKDKIIQDAAWELSRALADEGKLIEGGFVAFQHLVMSPEAPPMQVSEMRLAFMAGADHLFSSVMSILDPTEGVDVVTETDIRRMDLIKKELDGWRAILVERVKPTGGKA